MAGLKTVLSKCSPVVWLKNIWFYTFPEKKTEVEYYCANDDDEFRDEPYDYWLRVEVNFYDKAVKENALRGRDAPNWAWDKGSSH